MSKDSFSWKSLFVNDEGQTQLQKEEQGQITTPPSSQSDNSKFPEGGYINGTEPQGRVGLNNPFISEIVDVYQKGFDSLNLSDFDFFEMYKSVMAVGVTNPQSYQMAFTMGKTIKPDLTKEYLIEKSKYYITEIQKVHTKYNTTGQARKNELDSRITRDKAELVKRVLDLENQIATLQRELGDKKRELSGLDSSNKDQYAEIKLKMEANDYAKNKIVDSVNLVVSGINQYL